MKRTTIPAAALSITVASALALMATSSLAAGSLPTLKLTLTKNTVTVGGSKVSGAVDVVTTVKGEAGDSPTLIRLKPGVTPKQFGKFVSKLGDQPFDAIDPYATIEFAGASDPSGTTSAQALLPPGNYVAVNNGNGFTPFTIVKSAHPASLPRPGTTVTAIDFAYRGADTLRDGELVRFENDGYLVHMVAWASTASVADASAAEADLLKGDPAGAKTYATGMGQFVGPISTGAMQQEVITEPPGVYVIFCAMNSEDGRDHFQLGMFRTIQIVK
jgi:hypothetical protein